MLTPNKCLFCQVLNSSLTVGLASFLPIICSLYWDCKCSNDGGQHCQFLSSYLFKGKFYYPIWSQTHSPAFSWLAITLGTSQLNTQYNTLQSPGYYSAVILAIHCGASLRVWAEVVRGPLQANTGVLSITSSQADTLAQSPNAHLQSLLIKEAATFGWVTIFMMTYTIYVQ